MSEIVKYILIVLGIIIGGYLVGRSLTKGVLKELDIYLGRKFINHKKCKEDGKEEEKKQF